jgi:hypothetical protein
MRGKKAPASPEAQEDDPALVAECNKPTIAPTGAKGVQRLSEDAGEQELLAYARWNLDAVTTADQEQLRLGRLQTWHVYEAGYAFSVLRDRLKAAGCWSAWQKEQKLDRSTVWRAIELFARAPDREAVEDMQLTQAYVKYGIVADEAPEPKAPAKTRRKTGNGGGRGNDRPGKDKARRSRRRPTGANGNGEAPAKNGPGKSDDFGFEFAEEEELLNWLGRLAEGANNAAKFPWTALLPLTKTQKQALWQKLNDDLEIFEPATLDDV